MIIWDGRPETFWTAVAKIRLGTDIESDHAVLSEVLDIAMKREKLIDGVQEALAALGEDSLPKAVQALMRGLHDAGVSLS